MDLKELHSFKLSDAITFHDNLNPKLFVGNHLKSEVSDQLKVIARDFLSELGIKDLDVKDITISGSNAAYSYTPHSDLDLHILVDLSQYSDDAVYQELFHAKKNLYNDSHDITINGIPVELYIQDSNEPVISMGEYSVLQDKWLRLPSKRRSNFDQTATKQKYEKLSKLAEYALHSKKLSKVKQILQTIKRYRQAGLDKGGEFGPENLAYKMLRSQGILTQLYDLRDKLHSKRLSLNGMYSTDVDEDYDPNGPPPGPEFKPTMPAGTVKVDVSDVYDWYKLGQHISNLKGLGQHDFGSGPPSTIMAFGSEPEEHKYIDALKKTGLTTTDIDPFDPKQPKSIPRQKVDPTYNVNEEEIDESFGTGPYKVNDTVFDIRRHAIDRLEQRNVPITTAKEMLRRISTMKDKFRNMQPHQEFWVHDDSLGISMGMRVLDSGKVQWGTTIIGKPYGRTDNPIIDLTESFDKPYPIKWEKSEHGDYDALATLDDGTFLSIMFNNEGDDEYQIEFHRNNSQEVTGEGDSQKVFATVLHAIQEFLKVEQPYHLIFSASKDVQLGQNGKSRAKLYDRLVKRYANVWGYDTYHEDHGDQITYELTKLKQSVAEDTKSTEHYNGIEISLEKEDDEITVTAMMSSGRELGHVLFVQEGDYLMPQDLEVEERYQGQGIAATMYDYVKSKGYKIRRSGQQTDAGAGFWDKHRPEQNVWEASGYIPSEKQKNDPRFKTALTVDVNPYSIKKNAKAFGWLTSRAGIPPTAKPSGKIS